LKRAARLAALAFVLAGCRQLFGIDEFPYVASDGAVPGDGSSHDASDADLGALTLTVVLAGSAVGTVMDDQDQLSCTGGSGMTCVASYAAGTKVSLTPTAVGPNEFDLWGGACADQNVNDAAAPPTCVIATGGMLTVTADFETGVVLNIIPSPSNAANSVAGSYISVQTMQCESGSACIEPLLPETVSATLHVTQDVGCAPFVTFNGFGCSTSPTCTVTFNSSTLGTGNIITVDYQFALGTGSGCQE
jgi:hypothetical protein